MAKKNGSVDEAPEGFERIGIQIEGWYSPEVDASKGITGIFMGIPLSREERDGKQGVMAFYPVRITRAGRFALADGETIDLEPGAIVGVGERHGLRGLAEHLGREVWVKSLGKKATQNGNTIWLFDLRVNPTSPAKSAGDQVPF